MRKILLSGLEIVNKKTEKVPEAEHAARDTICGAPCGIQAVGCPGIPEEKDNVRIYIL